LPPNTSKTHFLPIYTVNPGYEKPEKTPIFEEEKKMAEMTIPDYPRGITFEQVWAALMEDRRKSEEYRKQWEKEREEDRLRREEDRRKSEEGWRKLRKELGDLGNRFGEMVEHLVAPSITEKFEAMGFTFEQISRDHEIRNSEGKCIAEIDLLLENGDVVMAVEVKSKPKQDDIDVHIGRMEVLRQRADRRNDTRKFQGAIAGAIMSDEVRNYIHKAGFYAIEQTGDTVKITIPENFKPREW